MALQYSLHEEEKRIRIKSGIITVGLLGLLLLAFLFWIAYRHVLYPKPKQNQYEILGAMDFGDMQEGRLDMNNFFAPVPDPVVNQPPTNTNNSPSDPQQSSTENNDVTSTEDSPIENPPVENPKPVQDDPKPDPQPDPNPNPTPNPNPNPNPTPTNNNNGGSNHGNNGDTGNSGTPDSKVLDPRGLYGFGSDIGGKYGRKPLDLPEPKYVVQEEAKITFEFTIAPDGHVKYVKQPITPFIELRKAGMEAIYKWKFDPIDSEDDQTTKVTITFRLK